MRSSPLFLGAPLFLALAACPGPPDTTCATGGIGSLELALTFPTSPGQVLVYDESGALIATVDASTTINDLHSGLYTLAFVRASTSATGGAATGTAWGLLEDTVREVCVPIADTVVVPGEYTQQPSSAHLWVSGGERLAGFAVTSLARSGDVYADHTLDIALTNDLRGFAFDPLGNLWVATSPTYDTRLLVFTPGSVQGDAAVEAAYTLAPAVFAEATQIAELAFDADGNLWTLVRGSNSGFVGLYVYTAAQQRTLLLGGDPGEPATTRIVPGLVTPSDLLFGPTGDLWIADFDGNAVLRVPAADLAASALDADTTLTPAATLVGLFDDNGVSGELTGPTDLALTSDGTLWVTYWTAATLAGFTAADTLDGSLLPDLTAETGTMSLPAGLATDAADGVWYGNEPQDGSGELVRITAEGEASTVLRSTAQPTPIDLAFDPVP